MQHPGNLKVEINGDRMEFPAGTTIAALLQKLEIQPLLVAVERNRNIVPKTEFERCELTDGDRIEIVHFVGGG